MDNQVSKSSFNFNSVHLLKFLYSKRKILIIVTIIGIIASTIVSLIITPKYESSIVFYPRDVRSISKALLSQNEFQSYDLLRLGSEKDVEKFMQIVKSDSIKKRLAEKFNLVDHYGFDPNSKHLQSKIEGALRNNIKIQKTKFWAIRVTVRDYDSRFAARMAKEVGRLLDSTIASMQQEIAQNAFNIMQKEYNQFKEEIASIEDSLQELSAMGIYGYESQLEALNEAYAQALANGATNRANKIENKLQLVGKYGPKYQSLQELLKSENQRLSDFKAKYQEARVNAKETLSQKFMVENAYVADKEAYPNRSLIVIISTIFTFVFCALILVIIEYIKKLRKTELAE